MNQEDFGAGRLATQRKRPKVTPENRGNYRHPVHWRIALIHKNGDKNDTYHGRTNDLSVSSATVFVDKNIFVTSEVIILLAIPAFHAGQKETIVEIQSSMSYTVLDSEQSRFRIALRFLHFKGEGKRILSDILSKRSLPKSATPSTIIV